jgi:hypothetical protein
MALTLLPDRQYTAPSAADAVTITPNATAWANSAYVQLLAATPSACVLTGVTAFTTDGSGSISPYDFEIDIATGGVGSEVVIATVRGYEGNNFGTYEGPTGCWVLPIGIDNLPTGVRLATRLRKAGTTTTAWTVAITYLQKPLTGTPLTTATVLKTLPPAAAGVTVTAGSPAWASGTWAQLRTASGSALVLAGIVFGAVSVSAEFELDLGTGGAGSEAVITTLHVTLSNAAMPNFLMFPTPLDAVAASTRLAARLRCLTASASLTVSLMVFEKPL